MGNRIPAAQKKNERGSDGLEFKRRHIWLSVYIVGNEFVRIVFVGNNVV